MIYLVYGDDRRAQQLYIKRLQEKYTSQGFLYTKKAKEDITIESLEQSMLGSSMFEEGFFIVLDGFCENQAGREYIEKKAALFRDAKNVVVLQESKTEAPFLSALKDYIEDFKQFVLPIETTDFTLWKAVYAGDKKGAWQAYLDAQERGGAGEQIHVSLFSQYKNIYKVCIQKEGTSYSDIGFTKESVYILAQKAAARYTEARLQEILYELTSMPSRSRSEKGGSMKILLEAFLLRHV